MRRRVISYDAPAPSIEYVSTHQLGSTAGASHTHPSMALGDERADRKMFVCVGHSNTAFLSALTVAGQAAALVVRHNSTVGDRVEIWSVALPTGTIGDVVITANSMNWVSSVSVYAGYGLLSTAATDTGVDTVGTLNTSVSVSGNGVVISNAWTSVAGTPGTPAWSNVTQDMSELFATGMARHSTASTTVTAAATVAPQCAGLNGNPVMVTASFR